VARIPSAHRSVRWAAAVGCTIALAAAGVGSAAAEPNPVVPSAEQVAAANAAAVGAEAQVATIDAELAAARRSLQEQQEHAGARAEEYNAAAEELAAASRASEEATAKATAAAAASETAALALSRYAAEVFQSGGMGQLDVFFGAGGPGSTLERAAGLEAVGEERARVMRDAESARLLSENLSQAAAEAQARKERASATAKSAFDIALRDNAAAEAAAAAVAARQTQALAQLAKLRNTSVELEQQRQDGLAAIEEARLAEEAKRKAEEAARKAAEEEAARKAAEEARKAAEEAAKNKPTVTASPATTPSPSTTPRPSSTSAPTSTTPKPTATPTPTTLPGDPAPKAGVDAVLAFARAQLGEPYVWGGAGPDSWDCSGLTMMAWRQAGVRLTHFAASQYQETARVPLAQLKPGDLLFYGTSPATIHHVTIYIGNGQMIHAPYTGTVVKIATIWRSDLLPYGGRP